MLPNNLKYMNKVESAPARQYTSTVQPQGGTSSYGVNTKCIINIPTSPNTVLVPSESFLKFNIDGLVGGAAACNFIRLDKCGAHGCIQRVRVYHGSTLIEDIDNYGALVALMMVLQQSADSFAGKQSILAGTTNSGFTGVGAELQYQTVGERLTVVNTAPYTQLAIGAVIAPRTYALNLLSFIGSLSGSQYIPLFEMTAAPLTLEIQFVSSALKFLCVDTALASNNFTINNIEFVGTFIELSDDSINIIRQSQMGQPLQYVTQTYANLTGSVTLGAVGNSTTSAILPIAAKYASLKSLFAVMRTTADGVLQQFPFSFCNYGISDWRIRIGSQILPAKAPNSMAEHYAELLKAIGSLSDINHEPSISYNTYNAIEAIIPIANVETAGTTMTTSTQSNNFAIGFDCETYSNSNKDRIFAGMNTLNSDIFWNINFLITAVVNTPGAAVNAGLAVRFDFYALFDQVIMFENGMVRVVK